MQPIKWSAANADELDVILRQTTRSQARGRVILPPEVGRQFAAKTAPYRWLAGDTPPHRDVGGEEKKGSMLLYVKANGTKLTVGNQTFEPEDGDAVYIPHNAIHSATSLGTKLILGPIPYTPQAIVPNLRPPKSAGSLNAAHAKGEQKSANHLQLHERHDGYRKAVAFGEDTFIEAVKKNGDGVTRTFRMLPNDLYITYYNEGDASTTCDEIDECIGFVRTCYEGVEGMKLSSTKKGEELGTCMYELLEPASDNGRFLSNTDDITYYLDLNHRGSMEHVVGPQLERRRNDDFPTMISLDEFEGTARLIKGSWYYRPCESNCNALTVINPRPVQVGAFHTHDDTQGWISIGPGRDLIMVEPDRLLVSASRPGVSQAQKKQTALVGGVGGGVLLIGIFIIVYISIAL